MAKTGETHEQCQAQTATGARCRRLVGSLTSDMNSTKLRAYTDKYCTSHAWQKVKEDTNRK